MTQVHHRRLMTVLIALVFVILPSFGSGIDAQAAHSGAPSLAAASGGKDRLSALPDGEVTALRTRTSRTFLQDGHHVTTIAPGSMNYQDANGDWQPITSTLIPSAKPGYAYENKADYYKVYFPADIGDAPIRVEGPGGWIAFGLQGVQGSGSVAGATDTYAIPGAQIAYRAGNDVMKESIMLSGPTSPSTYVYSLQTSSGLTPQQNPNGGIDFVDAAGTTQFAFLPPSMVDAAGASSAAVTMTLAGTGSATTVTLSADPTWLADPARVFPVTIDPQTVSNFGKNDTSSGNQDCYLDAGVTTSNCLQGTINVGRSTEGAHNLHGLLQFNIHGIPATATVIDAELGLYIPYPAPSSCPNDGTPINTITSIGVYAMNQSWTTAATWSTSNGVTPWGSGSVSSAAADINSSVGLPANPTGGQWFCWYPRQLVANWINGTTANDGVQLREPTETVSDRLCFASGENATSSTWPYLRVQWDPQTGAMGSYPLVGHGAAVNLANGNLLLDLPVFNLPGIGLPLSVGATYNSRSSYGTFSGAGWNLMPGNEVKLYDLNTAPTYPFHDHSIEFFGPSGEALPFWNSGTNGGVTTFTSPPGLDATLVQNADSTYTLTDHASRATMTFSSGGSLTQVADRSGNTASLTYGTVGGWNVVTSVTDTQGKTTTYTYDSTPHLTQITDPAGRHYTFGYTGANLTSYTDPMNHVTSFGYSSGNGINSIIDPNNVVTQIWYDTGGSGKVVAITSTKPSSTSCATPPAPYPSTACATQFQYNSGNTVVTDPNGSGHTTTYTYDALGRVGTIKDAQNHTTQLAWTADNQISQVTSPANEVTTYSYDSNNNLTGITAPGNITSSAAYLNSSFPYQPSSVTDAQGNASAIAYDTLGRPTSVTDARGYKSSVAYNSNGTVASETDARGNVTSYTYFPSTDTVNKGLLQKITPPATSGLGPTTFTYTSGTSANYNLPAAVQDGKGQTLHYAYDALGRTTDVTDPNGVTLYQYLFDADGNVINMVDGTGTTTYEYDLLNQQIDKTLPSGTKLADGHSVDYAFDGAGNLLTKTDSAGTITYGYRNDDLLTSVQDRLGNTTTLSYNADGERTAMAFANGVTESMSYSSAGQLTNMKGTTSGNVLLTSHTYGYTAPGATHPADLPYSVTNDVNGNTRSFTYDATNQLTQMIVKNSGGAQVDGYGYSYDQVGNLIAKTRPGTAWTWGLNSSGQLGNGTTTTSSTPAQVSNLSTVTVVAAGDNHTLAITGDGTISSWGANASGQLGNYSTTNSTTPVDVLNLTAMVGVAAGSAHSVAVKSDGSVWSWGLNSSGQLGTGNTTNQILPVKVSTLSGVTAVAAGGNFSLALKSDGTVSAWGQNSSGQLGNGTTTNSSTPVSVSGLSGVVAIAAGASHALAVKSDGTVWSWGANATGQLGNGTTTNSSTPVQVSGITNAIAVAGGSAHSLALIRGGTVSAWGSNSNGQLGNGTTTNSSTPVTVSSLSGVASISAGASHSLTVTGGMTAWAWGANGNGQLGQRDHHG